jgi:hypothetical protein
MKSPLAMLGPGECLKGECPLHTAISRQRTRRGEGGRVEETNPPLAVAAAYFIWNYDTALAGLGQAVPTCMLQRRRGKLGLLIQIHFALEHGGSESSANACKHHNGVIRHVQMLVWLCVCLSVGLSVPVYTCCIAAAEMKQPPQHLCM